MADGGAPGGSSAAPVTLLAEDGGHTDSREDGAGGSPPGCPHLGVSGALSSQGLGFWRRLHTWPSGSPRRMASMEEDPVQSR